MTEEKKRKNMPRYKHNRLLHFVQDLEDVHTVVEFGSWYGKSTVAMALSAQRAGRKGFQVYAVDTWLGSAENWCREDGLNSRAALLLDESGRPRFYHKFLRNVHRSGVRNLITPLSMTTQCAAEYLPYIGVEADLVYIDAAHDFYDVVQDVRRASRICKEGGVLCGDDYEHEPEVAQAVAAVWGTNHCAEGDFWWTKNLKQGRQNSEKAIQ